MQLEELSNISDSLAMMPDPALQQFAQMHKQDPYMVSLALSESNRRKKLRTAKQGQAGAMQQPRVVDTAIQGMQPAPAPAPMMAQQQLPENQGIARIPTPNMRTLADGGIAGYEDDEEGMATGGMGGMFNFAQQSEPVVRMADGGHVPRYQGNTMDGSVVGGIPGFQAVQPRAEFTQAGSPENMTPWERFSNYMGEKKKQATLAEIAYRIQTGIATPDEIVLYNSARIASGDKATKDSKYPPQDTIRTKDFPGVKPGFEKMLVDAAAALPPSPPGAKPSPPLPPPGAAPVPQAKLPTGIETLKEPTAAEATAASDKFFDADALTRRLEQQRLQERQDIATEATTRGEKQAAFSKEQGPAMAGYAKLLDSEEKQDVSDKEKAGLMALFKGFLGIAAGESPNAATNIAKGSMVGLEDYNSALKDLKKSAKERNKERAYIENAQRAESRDDFKSQQSFEDKANDASRAADRAFTSAITQVTGKKGEIASGIYKDMVGSYDAFKRTMYTGDVQERVANIQAGATRYSADKRSTDQKDMIESIRGGQLVETAIKNLREQINKSDKYGTQADKDAAFEKLWPEVLQMNPNLAKYAGTIGGGGTPAGGADFVLNAQTGKIEPRK